MHTHKETRNFCWCIISERLKMEELAAQKSRAQGRKKMKMLCYFDRKKLTNNPTRFSCTGFKGLASFPRTETLLGWIGLGQTTLVLFYSVLSLLLVL